MKKYLVFKGKNYYPGGGMEDFLGDADSLEEGIALVNENILKEFSDDGVFEKQEWIDYQWEMCWAHVYDVEKREIVWSK